MVDILNKHYVSLANAPCKSLMTKITYHFMIIAVTAFQSFMYKQLSQKTIQFFKAPYSACCLTHAGSCFGVTDADP